MAFKEPDPVAVDELAQTCAIKPDFDLHKALHNAAKLHDVLSSLPKRKQQKDWLDQVIKSADALTHSIDNFESVLSGITPWTHAQMDSQSRTPTLGRPSELEHQRACVAKHAESISAKAKLARCEIENANEYISLLKLLINVYQVAAEAPDLTLRDKRQETYGEFFGFIATCLRIIGVQRERMTLHNDLSRHRKPFMKASKSKKAIQIAKAKLNFDHEYTRFLCGSPAKGE